MIKDGVFMTCTGIALSQQHAYNEGYNALPSSNDLFLADVLSQHDMWLLGAGPKKLCKRFLCETSKNPVLRM